MSAWDVQAEGRASASEREQDGWAPETPGGWCSYTRGQGAVAGDGVSGRWGQIIGPWGYFKGLDLTPCDGSHGGSDQIQLGLTGLLGLPNSESKGAQQGAWQSQFCNCNTLYALFCVKKNTVK